MNNSFPKEARLRTRRDYLRLSSHSKRHVGKFVIIDAKKNRKAQTRLGITASRRFGKAHVRNRFKRIVREAFRLLHGRLPAGLDMNVRPRTAAYAARTQDVMQEFVYFTLCFKD